MRKENYLLDLIKKFPEMSKEKNLFEKGKNSLAGKRN
jgi:hypothetical protein